MNQVIRKGVCVGGLGVTGDSLIQYCTDHKIPCFAFDDASEEGFKRAKDRFQGRDVEFFFKVFPEWLFERTQEFLLSPGVPLTRPWVQEALKRKIPVTGELEFASRFLVGGVLAVTGTNGKTTTVSLIYTILKEGGVNSSLKGNIGSPLITAVAEPPRDVYVVEVSSYQLETIRSFHPKISVLLNMTQDHLDRYASMEDYIRAKGRIFENQTSQDFFIYNADDTACLRLARTCPARTLAFSLVNQVEEGAYIDGESFVISQGGSQMRYPKSLCRLEGLHNQENVLAATLACTVLGMSPDAIRKALPRFSAPPHRLQNLGLRRQMTFYDDSKGTNVGAVIMALASFDGNVILIMGGRDKGSDYTVLKSLVQSKVKTLILMGEAREKIYSQLRVKVPVTVVADMKEAVAKVFEVGQPGDTVLLSPGCSSFDQYKNYEERGTDFKRWVEYFAVN